VPVGDFAEGVEVGFGLGVGVLYCDSGAELDVFPQGSSEGVIGR
jgi:hypothetical protein